MFLLFLNTFSLTKFSLLIRVQIVILVFGSSPCLGGVVCYHASLVFGFSACLDGVVGYHASLTH